MLQFFRVSDNAIILEESARSAKPSQTFTLRPREKSFLCLTIAGHELASLPCRQGKNDQLFEFEESKESGRVVVAGRGRCLHVDKHNTSLRRCDIPGNYVHLKHNHLAASDLCLGLSGDEVIACEHVLPGDHWLVHGEDDVMMTVSETFLHQPLEQLYGFGEHQNGALDQSGKK